MPTSTVYFTISPGSYPESGGPQVADTLIVNGVPNETGWSLSPAIAYGDPAGNWVVTHPTLAVGTYNLLWRIALSHMEGEPYVYDEYRGSIVVSSPPPPTRRRGGGVSVH